MEWPNGTEGGGVHQVGAVHVYWTHQWAVVDRNVQPLRIDREQAASPSKSTRQFVISKENCSSRPSFIMLIASGTISLYAWISNPPKKMSLPPSAKRFGSAAWVELYSISREYAVSRQSYLPNTGFWNARKSGASEES